MFNSRFGKVFLPLFSLVIAAAVLNGCTESPGSSKLRKRFSEGQKAALLKQNALDGASKPVMGAPEPDMPGKDAPDPADDSGKDEPTDGSDDSSTGKDTPEVPTDDGDHGKDNPTTPPPGGDDTTGGKDPGQNPNPPSKEPPAENPPGKEPPVDNPPPAPQPPAPPPPPTSADGAFPSVTLCSNVGTSKAGTNVKSAAGVSLKVYNLQAAMVFENSDAAAATAMKADIVGNKQIKLNLPLTLGNAELFAVLCDVSKHASCSANSSFISSMKNATNPTSAKQLRPGMVGFINGVKISSSAVSAKKAIVLLEDNKTQGGFGGGASNQDDCDKIASPLVVDVKGKAVKLSSPEQGVKFDIKGDGVKRQISWPVYNSSAFIVLDRDGDGKISSVAELFGNNTVGPDGQTAANGFEALKKYDANGDLSLDAGDAVYDELKLWFDRNRNGETDAGELVSLRDAGLTAIDLDYAHGYEVDKYGNQTRERSVADFGGILRMVFDIWFKI